MTTALMSPPSASATMTFGLTTPTKPTNSTNKISSNNGSSISSTPAYKVPKFLRSLYSILQNEDLGIVTWVQNAELKPNRVTAFHILAQDRFENEVLPKYFKHSKFASFQRQLNNFGFRKWTKTQSSGVCTFSHNCFPPDPREAGVLRASIREQWRQKNTTDTRRRVGNGITKAERKLQQQVQQQVQQHQLPTTTINATSSNVSQLTPAKDSHAGSMGSLGSPSRVESFSEMLKTPLPNELDAFSRAPTHQPLTKTLARPGAGEWVSGGSSCNGLESPVKPAHLPHVSHNNTINIGTATPHQHVMSMYPVNVSAPSPPQPAMVIATTQLEPWAWNPHAAPVSYEVHPGSFHMEMGPWTTNHNHHHVHHQDPSLVHKGVFYHHSHHTQQQVSPSSMEEFTFDNLLLFAE